MGHPLLEEFCRVSGQFRPEFLRRCQRVFREEIQPKLDEHERMQQEIHGLRNQLQALQGKAARRRSEAAPETPEVTA